MLTAISLLAVPSTQLFTSILQGVYKLNTINCPYTPAANSIQVIGGEAISSSTLMETKNFRSRDWLPHAPFLTSATRAGTISH